VRSCLSAAAALATLVLAAGCGSSSNSASSGTSTGTGGSTTAHAGKKGDASGGLKYDTTPKYASPSSSAPAQSGVVQVTYNNIAIDPDAVKAKVGSTVKWTNDDSEKCNVTSEGGPYKFASGDIGEGASFELKLDKPGVIHYECTYYPATMNGTVEVVE
jgi:plastocyanin